MESASVAEPLADGPAALPVAHAAPLVLLVEDDVTLRDIVRRNLEARGYRVSATGTLASAIAVARHAAPAVILLDVNLPDGSGWDVLRALEAERRRIPTVVMSAMRCSAARLQEFQPDAYLLKPFPLTALLAAVERLARISVPVQ
jgi:DNA-binding response OmpR family regulator